MKKERIQKAINRIRDYIRCAFRFERDGHYDDAFFTREAAVDLALTLAEAMEVDYEGLESEFRALVKACAENGHEVEWEDKKNRECRRSISRFLNKIFGIDWAKM